MHARNRSWCHSDLRMRRFSIFSRRGVYVEHMQDRRNGQEQIDLRKLSPGTDPATSLEVVHKHKCYSPSPKTKCNTGRIPDIGIQLALFEESLRIEFVRIGIGFRVMQHCPIAAVIRTRVNIEKRTTRTIYSLLQQCLLV